MELKNKIIESIGLILSLSLALICLVTVSVCSNQASLPVPMPQEFIGEYSYDGENWHSLDKNANISALNRDLFLRGHFLREMKAGWQLRFYRNHIGISIKLNGEQLYMDTLLIYPNLDKKIFASMCAREWMGIIVSDISTQDIIEIRLHNPHAAGNKTAYRDFLTTLCSDMPGTNILQQNLKAYGVIPRMIGIFLAVASLMLSGAAIAAVVVQIPVSHTLFQLGLLTFCAGGFIAFDTIDLSLWSELNVLNTYTQVRFMIVVILQLTVNLPVQ